MRKRTMEGTGQPSTCRSGISQVGRSRSIELRVEITFWKTLIIWQLGYCTDIPKGIQTRLVNLTFGAVYVDAPGELDLEHVQA